MRCTLYGFITDYVKDIFIEEILFDIREKLREVTQGTEDEVLMQHAVSR